MEYHVLHRALVDQQHVNVSHHHRHIIVPVAIRRHPRESRIGIGGRLGHCRLCARAIDTRRLRAALVRSSNILSSVSRYMWQCLSLALILRRRVIEAAA